ncbi:MAG: hypothetical protein CMP81_06075 [Fulvimarina sp.]|nr:hypothetical protein [Fulvimarina sp.]
MSWIFDLIGQHVTDADDSVVIRRKAIGVSAGGAAGAEAYLTACLDLGQAADDPAALIEALRRREETGVVHRLGFLVTWCAAVVRADFESRRDAVAARTLLAARADADYGPIATAFGADVLEWILSLVGTAIKQISALAADKSSVVRVETNLSLPASVIAWELYGDPTRGAELVRRNRVSTAMLMPVSIEALSS